jgi:predicted esterase
MPRLTKPLLWTLLAIIPAASSQLLLAAELVVYRIAPQETDPAIRRFNQPHYIVFDPDSAPGADLLVFMTGTGADTASVSGFMNIAAAQGYRAISLTYNDSPAVVGICPQDPDSDCSGKFRQKRIFGDDVLRRIDDSPAESIVNRLTKLLSKLDHDHPSDGWGQYLAAGSPNWQRIVVAGHSQGAGMAAYIAQKKHVARVILFSSPWDFYGRDRQLAPWIFNGPGATPAESWFAAYHKKENTAALIERAYKGLKIPPTHIRALTLEPSRMFGENPYHLSVVGNGTTPRERDGAFSYAGDWRFLLGHSQ